MLLALCEENAARNFLVCEHSLRCSLVIDHNRETIINKNKNRQILAHPHQKQKPWHSGFLRISLIGRNGLSLWAPLGMQKTFEIPKFQAVQPLNLDRTFSARRRILYSNSRVLRSGPDGYRWNCGFWGNESWLKMPFGLHFLVRFRLSQNSP